MLFIQKSINPPADWDKWIVYTNGNGATIRMDDYEAQYDKWQTLPKKKLREYLLNEQNYKCAYCEQKITNEKSSIEHLIPKSVNKPLSTVYHNLVMVCLGNDGLSGGKHCDKSRGDKAIIPLVFYDSILPKVDRGGKIEKHSQFFEAQSTGEFKVKKNSSPVISETWKILNITDHPKLNVAREGVIKGITKVMARYKDNTEQTKYLRNTLETYQREKGIEFRTFVMVWLSQKIQ